MSTHTRLRPPVDYDADYHAWTLEQAERLRALRPPDLDWENVAEEIESLGRSDKREIESRLAVLLLHLLKLTHQPEQARQGWRSSVREHRRRILRILKDSPSLQRYLARALDEEYVAARAEASEETGLPLAVFPEACPFTIEQVLDPDFWPQP